MATFHRTLFALCVTLTSAGVGQAGLFETWWSNRGCTDCADDSCSPTIARPCQANIFTYQRQLSCLDVPCGEEGCGPSCMAPLPCASCCAPACDDPECCVPQSHCLGADCGEGCTGCGQCSCPHGPYCHSQENCQDIAQLIYRSMTACYARERFNAVHVLGDRFDCVCHPEIMTALVRSLNDTDERVRAKAADEIGDQVRRNRCCCGTPVIRALKFSLRDCDRRVRRQAEEALQLCGYRIVNGCCQPRCQLCPANRIISDRRSSQQPRTAKQDESQVMLVPPPAIPPEPSDEDPVEQEPAEKVEIPVLSALGYSDMATAEDTSEEQGGRSFFRLVSAAFETDR